jgi:MFS family permease
MLSITPRTIIAIFLTDSVMWGMWFGGLWSYRAAFASRITNSYTHIAISTAMPLIAASAIYMFFSIHGNFIKRYRVSLFKIAVVLSRIIYLATSYIILTNLFNDIKLLYITSIGFTIANTIGSIAGIAWADYIADNIPIKFKSRYIALDSTLGTLGALVGTFIAGLMLYEIHGIENYGRLFTTISIIFLIDVPLLMFIKELSKASIEYSEKPSRHYEEPIGRFYIAIVIIYLAINLTSSVIPPYIIYRFKGDEIWISMINGVNWIAGLVTPILWSIAVDYIGSLNTTKIAVTLAIVTNVVFPYMPSLYLQTIRAFLAGAAGVGIWITLISYLIKDVDISHRVNHIARVFTVQNLVPAIAMNLGGVLADALTVPEIVFMLPVIGFISLALLKANRC